MIESIIRINGPMPVAALGFLGDLLRSLGPSTELSEAMGKFSTLLIGLSILAGLGCVVYAGMMLNDGRVREFCYGMAGGFVIGGSWAIVNQIYSFFGAVL